MRASRAQGMIKQLGTLGLSMLFITLCFSGCEDLGKKSDHITVNVMVAVFVNIVDAQNNKMAISVEGIHVFIAMTKTGGDRLIFDRIVQGGLCQATGVIDLYKGQWINCTATVQDGYMGYYPVAPASSLLSWDTVNASDNFGNMYSWYPKQTIILKNGSAM